MFFLIWQIVGNGPVDQGLRNGLIPVASSLGDTFSLISWNLIQTLIKIQVKSIIEAAQKLEFL